MSKNLNTTGAPVHAGDRRRIWARFKDAAGTFTDPDAFTVVVAEAGGATTSRTLADFTRQATGEYYYDHTFSPAAAKSPPQPPATSSRPSQATCR